MKKTIIFDLDGTLLDSLGDIAIKMNEVLAEFGFEKFDIDRYRYFVGGGVDVLSKNVIKALGVEFDFELLTKRFKEVYENKLHESTKPYEGINELLKELKPYNLAVLSNKPHEITNRYIKKHFPNIFSQVFGQREHVPKKPNPIGVEEIISNFNVTCKDVIFVGDTKIDMQTATNANVKSIGVLWGFRDKKELVANKATYIVSKPSEILDIIKI